MKINRFEDIIAWQKAGKLAIKIYKSFDLLAQTTEIPKLLSGLIKTL